MKKLLEIAKLKRRAALLSIPVAALALSLSGCMNHNDSTGHTGNGSDTFSPYNDSGNASGNKGSISSGTSSTGDNSPVSNTKPGSTGANLDGLPAVGGDAK